LAVVAGVIRRDDDAVLISLRPREAHQGGLWEFPGGKLERGERAVDGLARELLEEIGILVRRALPLIRVHHAYSDQAITLEVLEVRDWSGQPYGREGQDICWTAADSLPDYAFPAANLPVITAARLPGLVLVVRRAVADEGALIARFEAALEAGVRLLLYAPQAGDRARIRRVGRRAAELCAHYGARLMVEGGSGDAAAFPVAGLHLGPTHLRQINERPIAGNMLLSATCRNRGDLLHAKAVGVDFAYLWPVRRTHQGASNDALGWHGLHRLAKQTTIPVYAAGGLCAHDARLARRAGCQGIALSSQFWDAAEPTALVSAVQAAIDASAYGVARTPD
jgi:8-oxo-dGTP diphosphatase